MYLLVFFFKCKYFLATLEIQHINKDKTKKNIHSNSSFQINEDFS